MTSNPPGAHLQVYVDGALTAAGPTPTSIDVKKGSDVDLLLALPGRRPARVRLDRSLSGGYLADFLLVAPLPLIVDIVNGAAWEYEEAVDVTLAPLQAPWAAGVGGEPDVVIEDATGPWRPSPGRVLRITVALLAGTGYGWTSGNGDVNADTKFSGGSRAAFGHLIPELGLSRDRAFVSVGVRYQVIDGTTDVYSFGRVYHARDSALAVFSRLGWLLRAPERRLQPFLSTIWGRGRIAHLAPLPQLQNCGPQMKQSCVDTVSSESWFLGAGGGLRWRLAGELYAMFILESQFGLWRRAVNVDGDVGLAMMF